MSTITRQSDDSTDDPTPPDREYGFVEHDSPLGDASLYTPDTDRIETNRKRYSSLDNTQIAWTPADLATILGEYDATELDVPTYYSRFEDEFDLHVCSIDTGGNRAAWGVTATRLEDAVRVAVDGGRFRSDDLSVYALDDLQLLVVDYDGDTWVVSTEALKSLPEDYDYDTTEVRGFTVPQDNDTVLRGMKRFLDLLPEYYDETIVGYDGLGGGPHTSGDKHYFERADGSTFYVRGPHLKKLGQCVHDPEEVQSEYTVETEYGEEYEVSWDEIEYQIGEMPRDVDTDREYWQDKPDNECTAGYQMRWEDPRTSKRVSMSGKVTCHATYFYIYRSSDGEYKVKDRSEMIAEFEPENEKYRPFN